MFGDLKKVMIIFSIIFVLFLAVGVTTASDISNNPTTESNNVIGINDNDFDVLNVDDSVSLGDGGSVDLNDDEADVDVNSSNPSLFSTHVEYGPLTKEYASGNIIYKVKAFEIWKSGDNKYQQSMQGQIKLKVYTGSSYKIYTETINNGVASFKIPNLAVGTHNVYIYVDGEKVFKSYIKIVKVSTTVSAPSVIVKYKKNNYYSIKVLNKEGSPVKKISIKVRIYTGKKSKTYKIKTNNYGIAKIQTRKLSLGTHKIVISSGNSNYKIAKNTKITIKKASKYLKMQVDSKVISKTNNYFNVKVVNNLGTPVKNITLKVKVFTGNNSKTYTVRTNDRGIAQVKTKKLSLGNHKVNVRVSNKKYVLNKNTKIKAVSELTTPTLVSLQYYQKGSEYYVKLIWNSQKSSKYQILKKTTGSYKVVSTITATKKTMAFYDKVDYGNDYTYTVREIISQCDGNKVYGSYDSNGLKTLDRPEVSVDFQNLKAKITWDKVDNASKYLVFRKVGSSGSFKCIATLSNDTLSYTDDYYKSVSELESILNSGTFADPSYNSLYYTVRAYIKTSFNGISKSSYGLYYKDGDFNLESPSVVSLKNNNLTWGKVPNAKGYLILQQKDGVWREIQRVSKFTSAVNSICIDKIDKNAYYSVQAFAYKNDEIVYSGFDEGFTLKNYDEANSDIKILYFGDSITYGSPYKAEDTRHIFSIPYRVAQLLGCNYYNPSIPGSTYHDLGQVDGKNVENSGYYRYRITREVVDPISVGDLPANWQDLDNDKNSEGKTNTCIYDYDVVVLSAGTNDYLDNSELGDEDSDDTSTFNGALNHILEKIEESSRLRVENGLSEIKVVFVDLFYSDRTYNRYVINNRDVSPNQIGLTLLDYQNALDEQLDKWSVSSEYLSFYNFKTRDYNIVNQENCPYTASDNLHYTKFTYTQYGNALAEFLLEEVI